MTTPRLLTLGHGTLDAEGLVGLLRDAGVRRLVDVRRFPGSRRDPSVGRDSLTGRLPAAGVDYRWEERLGGRRRVPQGQPEEVDGWWRVPAFRAYAAHTRTEEFRAGLAQVLEEAGAALTAVMCSETVWWRCHRRIVSDAAVLLHGVDVQHLGHDGRLTPHPPAEGARVGEDGLHYDGPPPPAPS
ncbi:hypothetical protein I601_1934 [Nocardioides dokdonensis FR1436]|uniref:DUF488 domain-containing protein n=1 Tax=Nocardioides dokdonensis FR1436 TaxID=1300347 RepID=A0A1A9GJC9_9ACTN|nr:DUF488 domain-containing protein [Nocardioides dokdonensis]ANH38364.1 hypothetical protein I601_1934 [Nocardioides dokdonensis FR1436]